MAHIESFTKGKTKERNEDFFGFNDSTFVMADGSTDKTDRNIQFQSNKNKSGKWLARKASKSLRNSRIMGSRV